MSGYCVYGQESKGMELYLYPGTAASYTTRVNYTGESGWYGQYRSSYEQTGTVGVSFGKRLVSTGSLDLSAGMGWIGGRLNGMAPGLEAEYTWKRLQLSSSVYYNLYPGVHCQQLLYSWTEGNLRMFSWLSVGLSLQQTAQPAAKGAADSGLEPGAQMTFTVLGWDLPVYLFRPTGKGVYFILGLCREWTTKNMNKH